MSKVALVHVTVDSRIDPRLSEKNLQAWERKRQREQGGRAPTLRVKHRPPTTIKDYAPGALVEKDMKFVLKMGQKRIPGKEKLKALLLVPTHRKRLIYKASNTGTRGVGRQYNCSESTRTVRTTIPVPHRYDEHGQWQ